MKRFGPLAWISFSLTCLTVKAEKNHAQRYTQYSYREPTYPCLGDTIVNPGTPLPVSKIVTSSSVEDDKDPNSMKGFAVVKAESIEAAIEIAKSDPFLENGGQFVFLR